MQRRNASNRSDIGAHKGSIEIEKSTEKEGDKNAFSRTAPVAGAGPRNI
ncbi:MAG TPA: hypothetical protein VFI45_20705 [Candidatus Acidoferrum sp.]|nr:hypothetical protein [Candidatus Acidoferrum sp.]